MDDANPSLEYVHTRYMEEPCSMLLDPTLDGKAYATAAAYVPTLRLKKWKPTDAQTEAALAQQANAFCYIDNDGPNSKQDYIMSTAACAKSDPLFRDAPFITRVFDNNTMDRSQNYPFNKCVIEVDPSLVTRDALQSFWTNVEKQECDALFAPVRAEIKNMQAELLALRTKVQAAQADVAGKERRVADGAAELAKLTEAARAQTDYNKQLAASLQAAQTLAVQRADELAAAKHTCAFDKAQQQQKQTDCSDQLQQATSRYDILTKAYERTQQALSSTAQELLVVKNAYTALYASYTSLQAAIKDLQTGLRDKSDLLKQSLALKKACDAQLAACKANRSQLEQQLSSARTSIATCKKSSIACAVAKDAASTDLAQRQDRGKELTTMNDSARTQLLACQADGDGTKRTADELDAILARLRSTREDCTPKVTLIESLKKQVTDILGWCKIASDTQLKAIDTAAAMVPVLTTQATAACADKAKREAPWTWTLEMWQDDNYGGNYVRITQDNLGWWGLYRVNEYRYAMTSTPFGTSSYKFSNTSFPTYIEFYDKGKITHRGNGSQAMGDVNVSGYNIVRGGG